MARRTDSRKLVHADKRIEQAWHAENRRQYYRLLKHAHEILLPLANHGHPHAQYLLAEQTLFLDVPYGETYDKKHYALLRSAAESGHAKAQFRLGQAYDSGGDLGEYPECSAEWFRLSAEQGYAYAQWVHGLNLLHGVGITAQPELGKEFIRLAAEGKFSGALEYLAEAYEEGLGDYSKDLQTAERYREMLTHTDVISY